MEVVKMILDVALKIAEAVETARENNAMCLDLAKRARTIDDILRVDRDFGAIMTAGGGDSEARRITRPALGNLKDALDEALKFVESQRQSGGIERAVAFITTDVPGEFQRLDTKISNCVDVLNYAKQVAAQVDNTRTKPSPQQQPSPPRPSDRRKQPLQPQLSTRRPSDRVKQPLQPQPQPSTTRPSDRVKQWTQVQPSTTSTRPSDRWKAVAAAAAVAPEAVGSAEAVAAVALKRGEPVR